MRLRPVSLKHVSSARFDQQFLRSSAALHSFESREEITNAPDSIARIRGSSSIEHLERRDMLAQAVLSNTAPDPRLGQVMDRLFLLDPDNYRRRPADYVLVDIALHLLFNQPAAIKGLQLASNYGPYLFALKERGIRNFFGADMDTRAARYAKEIGLNVVPADGTALPFKDSTFDVALSGFFLDSMYLPAGIIDRILTEVTRVLKPGGFFLSVLDDCFEDAENPFSDEIQRECRVVKNFKVLQKT